MLVRSILLFTVLLGIAPQMAKAEINAHEMMNTIILQDQNSSGELSLHDALEADLKALHSFTNIANSNRATKKQEMTALLNWAASVSEAQLGSWNPAHYANLGIIALAQTAVDSGHFQAASKIINSSVTPIVSGLTEITK